MMQHQLNAIYEHFKQSVELPAELVSRLTPPLLLNVPNLWAEADKRLLVVGQETLGWGFKSGGYYAWPYPAINMFSAFQSCPAGVQALTQGYSEFELARHQRENINSPFWRAYR